jgi:hypothetical protein
MKELNPSNAPTIHVKITVQKNGDSYEATYDPKIIEVTELDTIINFKLVTPTPDDVVIRSVSISPESQSQLSTPSISKNGKQMTLSDLNTESQTIGLSFNYRDKHNETVKLSRPGEEGVDYPAVVNNPPGYENVMLAMAGDVPVNNPPG